MKYNTEQNKLVNGEYGRNIQKMIEYCIEIKDRSLRNQQAKAIVRAMTHFAVGNKETEDYWHKLWDHLIEISNYQLDIDSPFPLPKPKTEKRLRPLAYPYHKIRFRPYGALSEQIILKLTKEEPLPEREKAVENIANQLKRQYLSWNRDSVNDALIIEHLGLLSGNKLKLNKNFTFLSTKSLLDELAITQATANAQAKASLKQAAKPTTIPKPAPNPQTVSTPKKKKKKKKNAANNPQQNNPQNNQNNKPQNNFPNNRPNNNPNKQKQQGNNTQKPVNQLNGKNNNGGNGNGKNANRPHFQQKNINPNQNKNPNANPNLNSNPNSNQQNGNKN